MANFSKKISLFFLAIFVFTAVFFSGSVEASFWDMIRAWVTINPLVVDVSAPKEVQIDKVFQVKARVTNKGDEKIEEVEGEIRLPLSGLVLLKKDPIQEIGVIPGKKEKKISWSVRGEEIGNYYISVKVSGELKGEGISAEDGIMIEVIKPSPRGRPLEWFRNLFDFFQRRFKF